MKKSIIVIAFIAIAQMSLAQESVVQDPALKAQVLKVIALSGSDNQMKMVKSKILKMIPEAKQAEFVKEYDATMPSFYDKLVKVYMETYTTEDVKAMIKFYESPVGKKMSEKAGEITEKSMKAGQEWGKEIQLIMEKYKEKDKENAPFKSQTPHSFSKPKE